MMTVIRKLWAGGWGWLTGHARLAIEYVLIAVVVALACTALYTRSKIAQQETKIVSLSSDLQGAANTINQQVAANKDQDAAIAKLNHLRELDGQAIAGLNADLHVIGTNDSAVRNKIAQLEARNAQAKALLDTAVPADVGCVLDRTACPAGHDTHGSADRQTQ